MAHYEAEQRKGRSLDGIKRRVLPDWAYRGLVGTPRIPDVVDLIEETDLETEAEASTDDEMTGPATLEAMEKLCTLVAS